MTDEPLDTAAVEAAEILQKQRWVPAFLAIEDRVLRGDEVTKFMARIITEAYAPHLTAERSVREKLVEALGKHSCRCSYMLPRGARKTGICSRCTALAAAEKLEDAK